MFVVIVRTPLRVFLNTEEEKNCTRKEGRQTKRRIKPREGCEGQDEVKKDTGGKLVKGSYTLPLSRLGDRQGARRTSVYSQ